MRPKVAGQPIRKLRTLNVPIASAGCSATDPKAAGLSHADLEAACSGIAGIKAATFSMADLNGLADLKAASPSTVDWEAADGSLDEAAGSSRAELKAGFSLTIRKRRALARQR